MAIPAIVWPIVTMAAEPMLDAISDAFTSEYQKEKSLTNYGIESLGGLASVSPYFMKKGGKLGFLAKPSKKGLAGIALGLGLTTFNMLSDRDLSNKTAKELPNFTGSPFAYTPADGTQTYVNVEKETKDYQTALNALNARTASIANNFSAKLNDAFNKFSPDSISAFDSKDVVNNIIQAGKQADNAGSLASLYMYGMALGKPGFAEAVTQNQKAKAMWDELHSNYTNVLDKFNSGNEIQKRDAALEYSMLRKTYEGKVKRLDMVEKILQDTYDAQMKAMGPALQEAKAMLALKYNAKLGINGNQNVKDTNTLSEKDKNTAITNLMNVMINAKAKGDNDTVSMAKQQLKELGVKDQSINCGDINSEIKSLQ